MHITLTTLNNVDYSNMPHGGVLAQSPFSPSELGNSDFDEFDDPMISALTKSADDICYRENSASLVVPITFTLPKYIEDISSWENSNGSLVTYGSSALNKELIFSIPSVDSASSEWKHKPIKEWEPNDVMYWMLSVGNDDVAISQFSDVDGSVLCNMCEIQFVDRDPKHGRALYAALQQLKQREHLSPTKMPPFSSLPSEDSRYSTLTDLNTGLSHHNDHLHSDLSSTESAKDRPVSTPIPVTLKRKVGRPRLNMKRSRKPEKRTGRLWEFIRDLLLNREYCPSLICWENHDEGVFRFVRSEKVAQLWGTIKENPKMTYEKLSRAMRYYYKSKVLQPVLGRRLVYKFGPTATGWRTDNPNFRP